MTSLTRRSFLGLTGTASLGWACSARVPSGPAGAVPRRPARSSSGTASRRRRRIPIALQLYSVRGDCKRDFDATLDQVAAMGFEGVEFAGYYGYAGRAADLRKRLDALALKAAGTHIGLEALQGDALKATVEFHQIIGCRFLIVPGNPAFTDPEKSKALADTFNRLAATLKPLGMSCGYHNHTAEFRKDGERTYWDLFAERTTSDVILQQDCGWTLAAGFDPIAYVLKYPGRARSVHIKPTVRKEDTGRKAILGQDSVDWPGVLAACASKGGTQWYVLEQETYPDGKPPMQCTRESLAGLKALVA